MAKGYLQLEKQGSAMSSHHGKLLELLAIESKSDDHFLHIKLSFSEDIEVFWKIDGYTADNLRPIAKFDKKSKYRLSLNTSWDVIQKRYISTLTRTYLDQSERVYFPCSEDYVNQLSSIKHSHRVHDLDIQDFTPIPSGIIHQHQQPKNKIKPIYIPLVIMCFLLSIILGYSGLDYLNSPSLNKQVVDEQALAKPASFNHMAGDMPVEKLDLSENILPREISYDLHTLPFAELDQIISYSIAKGTVALTFSDGPSKYSTSIMNILNKYQVGGTFFFTGSNIKKYSDDVKSIHSSGYSIGTHSMNHPNLPNLSYEKQEDELLQPRELLEEITGDKIILFRPPYGAFNEDTKDLVNKHQYKMVLWNNDPRDWETRNADTILSDIQNSTVSGSIIILQESQATLEALPRIIEYLQGLDLQIVSLK